MGKLNSREWEKEIGQLKVVGLQGYNEICGHDKEINYQDCVFFMQPYPSLLVQTVKRLNVGFTQLSLQEVEEKCKKGGE